MRKFGKWAVILLVPAFCIATALAQEGTLPEGTTIKLLLLRQKSVQKELEIPADVAKKINAFTTAQSEAAGDALKLVKAERKKAFAELEKANKAFIKKTLDEKQSKRLDQIAMQFTALQHLTKAKTIKALKLTEEQVQKLKDMQAQTRKDLLEIVDAKHSKKFAKLREKTRLAILALLTEEQQAQVREMAGAPFTGEIIFEVHKSKE